MKKLSQIISIKSQFIVFLSCVLIYLSYTNHNLPLIYAALIAIFTAVILDSAILSFKNKKFSISESAVISGLIIAFVLDSENAKWIFIVAPVFSILSKQLLRFHNKHFFNPAALGIFAVMILFKAQIQWLGNNLWYIFIPFGIYFIWMYRKFEIVLGYLLGIILTLGIYIGLIQKGNLLDIVNYLSYFFIFVMLIEPKTTPINTYGKYLFGFGVALLAFVFTIMQFPYDIDICTLLIFNLFVPFFNKIPNWRPSHDQIT